MTDEAHPPENELAAARIRRERWRALEAERRLAALRAGHFVAADLAEAHRLAVAIVAAELRAWVVEAGRAVAPISDTAEAEALLRRTLYATQQRIVDRLAATARKQPPGGVA